MTRRTSNRFASSAIEMYVRRSVCGVVVGSAGSSRASGLVDARTAASRTIALTCWRVMPWHELAVTAQYLAGKQAPWTAASCPRATRRTSASAV
jgi:hypothetical protein